MSQASCRDFDPELWFPFSPLSKDGQFALAVCAGCPVSEQCLARAERHGVRHGIWGGQWMENKRVADLDQDALRAAVRSARDAGWGQALIARHLRLPHQSVARLLREIGR